MVMEKQNKMIKHNILNGCFNLNDGIYVSLEVGSGNWAVGRLTIFIIMILKILKIPFYLLFGYFVIVACGIFSAADIFIRK